MTRLKDVQYADFRVTLQEKAGRPLHVEFELTHRCNLSCIHCYLGSLRDKSAELETGKVKAVLEKLHEAGFIWLVLTGGEPLLRKDFPEIYQYAKELGFVVIVMTNATLIDECMADLFARMRPFYLDISVHAAGEGLYDRITGSKGSFRSFARALGLLKERNIPFRLKTKAMKENEGSMEEIGNMAHAMGAPHRISSLIHRCIDGDRAPEEHMARPDDTSQARSGARYNCAAVNFSVSIDPMGKMMACQCARTPSYDILNGDALSGVCFLSERSSERECLL